MPPQFENTAWEVRNHFAANRSIFFFTLPFIESMIGLALHMKTWSTSILLNLLFLGNFSFTLKRLSLVDWIVDFGFESVALLKLLMFGFRILMFVFLGSFCSKVHRSQL